MSQAIWVRVNGAWRPAAEITITLPLPTDHVLHLEAADLLLSDTSPVGTWTSKNGMPFTEASGATNRAQYLANVVNGKPIVYFKSSSYLKNTAMPFSFPTGDFTVFMVMKNYTYGLYNGVMCFGDGTGSDFDQVNGFSLEQANSVSASLRCTHRAGNTFEYTMNFPAADWKLFSWSRSATAGLIESFSNLTSIGSQAVTGNTPIACSVMALNARVSSGPSFGASPTAIGIAELIIFNRALSVVDRNGYISLLMAKYALT